MNNFINKKGYFFIYKYCIFFLVMIFYKKNGVDNMISYNPLWKMLIDLGKNKSQLAEECNITRNTVAKMGRNEYVDLSTIEKICKTYNCNIVNILEYIPDK